jgi:anti-sigma-K factor RskA
VSDRQTIDPGGCDGNAAPYVLGALDEREAAAFRAHMESCAVCREEVAALQVVAGALPAAAPQVQAPPALKRRVMAGVREDARRTRTHARDASAELAPARTARSAGSRRRPALAAAAVAFAVAIAVVAVVLASGSGSQGTRVIRAEVKAPHARAYLSVRSGHAQLTVAGMPQSAPGHVYELWIKRTGAPVSTDTLFTVTSSGTAAVGVPGGIGGVTAVMVTSEPLGGSPAPTSTPVIVAPLS